MNGRLDGNRESRARVVVTGIGAVSAWGWGVSALRTGLRSGQTAIRPFGRFDHSRHRTHVAGQVPPDPRPLPPSSWRRLSWADRFAVFAATEAVQQSGVDPRLDRSDVGVYFGTSTAGLYETEEYLAQEAQGQRAPLGWLASQQLNSPGDAVARQLEAAGPVLTISSACASATLAIDAALRDLRSGAARVAIAGGADSLSQITYAGFNSLRAVDNRPCRPFRQDRQGMSLGEGAGVLVLETDAHARARGARPLAELKGAGASCDASHMTAPHPEGEGAALAMARALEDAGIGAEEVAFVNVHGTGTPLNDTAEWLALRRILGERASRVPLTATKASLGHLLGSAGAIEAVATVLAVSSGELDPTAGAGMCDPALPVDLVLGEPRPAPPGPALSTTLAFGGANAVLVFSGCAP